MRLVLFVFLSAGSHKSYQTDIRFGGKTEFGAKWNSLHSWADPDHRADSGSSSCSIVRDFIRNIYFNVCGNITWTFM